MNYEVCFYDFLLLSLLSQKFIMLVDVDVQINPCLLLNFTEIKLNFSIEEMSLENLFSDFNEYIVLTRAKVLVRIFDLFFFAGNFCRLMLLGGDCR